MNFPKYHWFGIAALGLTTFSILSSTLNLLFPDGIWANLLGTLYLVIYVPKLVTGLSLVCAQVWAVMLWRNQRSMPTLIVLGLVSLNVIITVTLNIYLFSALGGRVGY